MTIALKNRISQLREALETADPTVGFLAPPSERQSFPEEVPVPYQDLLRLMNGAACGVVMLYESDGLSANQSLVKGLPGGRARWFCFGRVEDYPLVIDRRTGAVHLVPLEGHLDDENSLGDLDHFLLTSVFGEDYADFVINPESDPWYQLIHSGS